MITGNISTDKIQIFSQNNSYFDSALKIITNTDFSTIDDGTYNIESNDFFYLLVTYKTKHNINETKAESHRKYIDFQCIISGEELIGYAGSILSNVDYNSEKDVSFYNTVSNESFFILKKDMFCIFYPDEIHRPGLSNKEIRTVRKAVFKIKVKF